MNAIPGYVTLFQQHAVPKLTEWVARFSPDIVAQIHDSAGEYAGDAADMVGQSLRSIVTGSLAFIDVLALSILTHNCRLLPAARLATSNQDHR